MKDSSVRMTYIWLEYWTVYVSESREGCYRNSKVLRLYPYN
jgi:hypothetical protein